MLRKAMIAVVARMDWHTSLSLLPAMGRTQDDTRVIQDIELPHELNPGFTKQVLHMIVDHGALEVFVIGSHSTETAQDIVDRVNSLREWRDFPIGLPVHGLLFNPATCKLDLVCKGYYKREEYKCQ